MIKYALVILAFGYALNVGANYAPKFENKVNEITTKSVSQEALYLGK